VTGQANEPIILTLQFDAAADAFFQRMRTAHYPPALNRIPAHLTLLHALPADAQEAVVAAVAQAARRPPFTATVAGLMPLGRGVAFRVEAPALAPLREGIARRFAARLTPQDRETFRPHVTIQNKVPPGEAKRTLAELAATFAPFEATAEGLQLWRYRGGPWAPLGAFAFAP
jgi:2'-5' RNA ligase